MAAPGIGRFRTAFFGGYNCDDVIAYITSMNRQAEKDRSGYEKTIADLEEEKNRLGAAAEELETKAADIMELASHAQTMETELREKNARVESLAAENALLKSTLSGHDIPEMENRIAELEVERNRLDAKASDLASKESNTAVLSSRVAALEAQLTVKTGLIDGLSSENASLKASLADIELKYDELSRNNEQLNIDKAYLVDLEIAARKRADDLTDATERRIQELNEIFHKHFRDAVGLFDTFRGDADVMVASTVSQLQTYIDMFEGLSEQMKKTQKEFYQAIDQPSKAEKALPGSDEDEAFSNDDSAEEDSGKETITEETVLSGSNTDEQNT